MIFQRLFYLLIPAYILISNTANARPPSLSVSTGYIFGDREDDLGLDTDVEIIPIGISYKTKQWKFKLSTAYLRITGPGDIFIAEYDDGSEDIFVETTDERKGLGDTFLSITHSPLFLKSKRHKLSLGYKYKAPTGSEDEGLSSGEPDHHLFLRGYYRIKRFMLLGRLGYQIMGDTDERDYNNRAFASTGLLYIAHKRFSIGTQYYTKQASLDGRDDIRSLSGIFQFRPSKHWSGAINISKGLSDTTLDKQIGLQVSHRF